MINTNVFRFTLGRSSTGITLAGFGLLVMQFLFVLFYAKARPDQNMQQALQLIPDALRSFIGAEYLGLFTVLGFLAFAFVHPVVLLLLGANAVALGSRSVAGGIGDGTLDLLVSQPVRRWVLVLSQALSGVIPAVVLPLCMWTGQRLGVMAFALPARVPAMPYLYAAANAGAFYLALVGISVVASALTSKRHHAVGFAVALIAVLLFVRLAAQIWHPLEIAGKLSPFSYYVPSRVVMQGAFPWTDIGALLAMALAGVLAAAAIFNRRDIR